MIYAVFLCDDYDLLFHVAWFSAALTVNDAENHTTGIYGRRGHKMLHKMCHNKKIYIFKVSVVMLQHGPARTDFPILIKAYSVKLWPSNIYVNDYSCKKYMPNVANDWLTA